MTEAYGGSVQASSPGLGEGAAFMFRLPLQTASVMEEARPPVARAPEWDLAIRAGYDSHNAGPYDVDALVRAIAGIRMDGDR